MGLSMTIISIYLWRDDWSTTHPLGKLSIMWLTPERSQDFVERGYRIETRYETVNV